MSPRCIPAVLSCVNYPRFASASKWHIPILSIASTANRPRRPSKIVCGLHWRLQYSDFPNVYCGVALLVTRPFGIGLYPRSKDHISPKKKKKKKTGGEVHRD